MSSSLKSIQVDGGFACGVDLLFFLVVNFVKNIHTVVVTVVSFPQVTSCFVSLFQTLICISGNHLRQSPFVRLSDSRTECFILRVYSYDSFSLESCDIS